MLLRVRQMLLQVRQSLAQARQTVVRTGQTVKQAGQTVKQARQLPAQAGQADFNRSKQQMTGKQTRRLDKYVREIVFFTDDTAGFPKGSPGEKLAKAQAVDVELIRTLTVKQVSEFGGKTQQFGLKDDDLDDLLDLMKKCRNAADLLSDDIEGIDDLFQPPVNRRQETIVATARSYAANAAPHEPAFVEYDLPNGFPALMESLCNAIETEDSAADSALEEGGEATGEMKAAFTRCGIRSRKMNAVVINKYGKNAGRRAAWDIARRLEKHTGNATPPTV